MLFFLDVKNKYSLIQILILEIFWINNDEMIICNNRNLIVQFLLRYSIKIEQEDINSYLRMFSVYFGNFENSTKIL